MADSRNESRLIIPAIVLSSLAMIPASQLTGLLLIDIGNTFQQPVSVMSQINTLSSLVGFVFALLMGILSIKYKHRTLLLSGLIFILISAIGCWISSSFLFMLLAFPLNGIGAVMVSPMTISLVGDYIPKEKRASVISWMSAGAATIYLIGGPFSSYLEGIGGWRLAYLLYTIPIAFASSIIAYLWIPRDNLNSNPKDSEGSLIGFQRVFSNRSAIGCLMGSSLAMAAWSGGLVFSSSFYRQKFGLETGTVAILTIGSALLYIGGNLFAGRFMNSFGMKRLSVLSLLLIGVLVVLWLNSPVLWMVILFDYIGAVFWGIRPIATQSLTLEQVSRARGTMMSMYTAAGSLGSALGVAVSGHLLFYYGYWALGFAFGILNFLSAFVFAFHTNEPIE